MTPMIDALNGLFQRIAELMDSERRFTADAAHELRTPIAAIRAQAEAALGEADVKLRRHALHATLEGCDRAARLVAQLLTLSRLEAGAEGTVIDVDLGELVRRVVADEAPQGLRKRQTVEVDAAVSCRVTGDATLLAVLVRNLVDNALRYSPERAAIRITVGVGNARVRLRVEDSGPGASDADMLRFGERFFRVLGSGEGGSGLGWSIVRRVAAVHRAVVEVSRSPSLGGLRVDVTWPPYPPGA
jgi:two-component system sensor histidine kinase QseC